MDPIHQFTIVNLFPIGKIGNAEIFFTNSALFMVAAVILLTGFLVIGTAGAKPVPGRLQSAAELTYEFVATMLRSTGGNEGMRFFPFVFTIFMFVLLLNLFGLIPYGFSVTSHVIITSVLSLTVFFTVLIYGLVRHGLHFFSLFWPKDAPFILALLIFPIELISFLVRPFSLGLRPFIAMFAGHILLDVFGSFVVQGLNSGSVVGYGVTALAFAFVVFVNALELLVGAIQAFVFALLTALYIHDAVHLH